ncbi:MAG: Ca-activated chloride channel [Acidobacteriota bacterium]|jgi:Ca-activated chloride channel family protein|nr:Ca-activated chloride channel [Acidobacteriota bacterium]
MTVPRNYSSLLLAAIGLLLLAVATLAQETSQPAQTPSQQPVVKLNVLVTDSSNQRVSDLRQEDFRVSEDGKPQTISYFSREELPVSYGLVVDASGSQRALLNYIIEAGRNIVSSNKPEDEAFVMRFVDADNIQVEQGFTSNKAALSDALDNIYVEGGLTALIDAVNQSLDYLKKNKPGVIGSSRRQAIILITDGEDRGSRTHADALLNRLREEDAQVFIIGLTKMSNLQSSREKAAGFLTRIAEASGGRAFFPKSSTELPGVVEEITRNLHMQYVIGYTPTNAARDGSYRKVQVTVPDSQTRKKLNVIARPGYTASR